MIIDSGIIDHSLIGLKDRIILKRYLEEGKSLTEIAKIQGEGRSKIYRDLEIALTKCVNIIFDLNLKKKRLKALVKENELLKNFAEFSSIDTDGVTGKIDIEKIFLSPRARKALLELGISDLRDMEGTSGKDICEKSSAGKRTMMEIADKCSEYGIRIVL